MKKERPYADLVCGNAEKAAAGMINALLQDIRRVLEILLPNEYYFSATLINNADPDTRGTYCNFTFKPIDDEEDAILNYHNGVACLEDGKVIIEYQNNFVKGNLK